MSDKVTLSIYIPRALRTRLIKEAARRQEAEGRRVSVNEIIVEAIAKTLGPETIHEMTKRFGGEPDIGPG